MRSKSALATSSPLTRATTTGIVCGTGLAGSAGFTGGAASAGLPSALLRATACCSVVLVSADGFLQPDTAQLRITSAAAPERKFSMIVPLCRLAGWGQSASCKGTGKREYGKARRLT